jgi:hypothetical protein
MITINQRQLFSMFRLISDVGFGDGVRIGLTGQDDQSGDLIANVTGEVTNRRYRFFAAGGAELLQRQDPDRNEEGTSEDDDDYPVSPHN